MKNIWDRDIEKTKLTNEMVTNAEKMLGVKLPNSYIELCKIQNGGYITYDAFPTSVPTGWADDHVGVDYINGIEEEGILSSNYYIEEWELPNDILLLCGDGHWWIAMDYRNTKEEPPIIYVDLEWGEDTFILELVPNFKTFLEGLYNHDD
ncbi:SMI1/KNR4 family protein [Siminovitchia terrae]|uniref:SMI1/KNR4 family protein n=1 Tax=Siminovitchia terrae TaxID=1914933 RepID=A0A429XCX3_SIMTE|nr:SMI1/KNR4 family protein [Siminovitchia terrae]RST61192.1 SMI1/KNR4 family protein [Siminovitchia terrae]